MDGIGKSSFTLLLVFICLPLFLGLYRKYLKMKLVKKSFLIASNNGGIGFDPKNYIYNEKGFKRSNGLERKFKRDYLFDLLEIYDHRCANCDRSKIKLECDHFFIPKSLGGNLMMKHIEGYWVSNAILLCRRCNSLKADKGIHEFFQKEKLKEIIDKNVEVSFLLNGVDFTKYRSDHTL